MRKANMILFFEAASERIERKYKAVTFSVAKSELSILCNIEELLNLNSSAQKETVIEGINERIKKRMVQGRKAEHSMVDEMLGAWDMAVIHPALGLWDEPTSSLKEGRQAYLGLFRKKKGSITILETLKSEVTVFSCSSYLAHESNDLSLKAAKTI